MENFSILRRIKHILFSKINWLTESHLKCSWNARSSILNTFFTPHEIKINSLMKITSSLISFNFSSNNVPTSFLWAAIKSLWAQSNNSCLVCVGRITCKGKRKDSLVKNYTFVVHENLILWSRYCSVAVYKVTHRWVWIISQEIIKIRTSRCYV